MEMYDWSTPRFLRDERSATARVLDVIAAEGWQVIHLVERSAHLVVGRCGAYLVVTEDPDETHWGRLLDARAGFTRVVVVWRPFPEEVDECDGIFLVHGQALHDFLRAQHGAIDVYEVD